MHPLVVRRDRHVDVLEGRVGVAEGDRRDVGVRRLGDRLVVRPRVRKQQQAGLEVLGVIWLVKVPGVKRRRSASPPCTGSTRIERWPYGRAEMTHTSAGFSISTITRAASSSLSYVRPRLMMWMPSGFRFHTYRVICASRFLVPRCVEHASIIWKSFFFCSSEMPGNDMVG